MLKVKPYFAWFDFWIGAYYDRAKHRLYISPFPCLGLCIQVGRRGQPVSEWRKIAVEGPEPDTGPIAYLQVIDDDGDDLACLMPEWLVDAILRDHELAQSIPAHQGYEMHLNERMPEWRLKAETAEVRIAELGANISRNQEWIEKFQSLAAEHALKIMAAEAEAAALRELVRGLTGRLAVKITSPTGREGIARVVWNGDYDSVHPDDLNKLLIDWLTRAESLLSEKAETPATAGESC